MMNQGSPHILVVDDHSEIRDLLKRFLEQHGMRVSCARDGKEMKRLLDEREFDLLVLDLMMPGEDGLTLCRELRVKSRLPIIMLTAMGEETDRIIGLEMGADDYLAKPFNPRELLARVKSLLRRTGARRGGGEDEEIFRFAGWTLNLPRRRLCDPQGADVALTRGEFEVLALLVRHVGEVINRDRLSRAISGHDWAPQDRTVDVLVRRLRAKLDAADKPDSLITTVRGEGYRLAVDVERAHG